MALQYSVAVRNAKLDAVETVIGVSALMRIFSGGQSANCAGADPPGLLCSIVLPADWMAAASAGSKAKLGTWSANASAGGTAASWRIYDQSGATCHMQGTTSDLVFDNTNIASGQTVTISGFTLNAGNS